MRRNDEKNESDDIYAKISTHFFAYNQVFRFSIAPFRVLYSFVSCLAGFAAIAYEGGKVYICPLLEL